MFQDDNIMKVSLEELVKSGAHFGHQSKRWNPKMGQYLYGEKDGIHIFDLTQTKQKLEEALEVIKQTAKEGKTILFIGTKKQVKEKLVETAKVTNSYYINERWLGGTLSNFDQIKKSIKKLADLKKGLTTGEFNEYTKKERLLLEREMLRLERIVGGLTGMEKRPDLLVVIDTKKESSVIKEAQRLKVTMVGISDSNSDPNDTDYVIPMNDDATNALNYVLDLMRDAIQEGKGITSTTGKKTETKLKEERLKKKQRRKLKRQLWQRKPRLNNNVIVNLVSGFRLVPVPELEADTGSSPA
jgi:small subunit ribosomal protein S2